MIPVGKVEELQFHIYKGKSFEVDVLWWANRQKTEPMVINEVRGKIKTRDSDSASVILDLTPTFIDNRAIVRVSDVRTKVDYQRGYLELEAVSGVSTKVLIRGPVVFHPEVSD